jgi:RimJ/RimL family protein N-acetyltransferase
MSDTGIAILGFALMVPLLLRWIYWERRLKERQEEHAEPIVIPTERVGVRLQQFTVGDVPPLFALIDSNREHLGQRNDITARKYPNLRSVRRSIVRPKDPSRLRFGIWDGDTLVGSINLTPRVADGGAEIGYWVGQEYGRRGYATVAVKALSSYGFLKFGRPIFCRIHRNNENSCGIMRKTDFCYVHTENDGYLIFTLAAR